MLDVLLLLAGRHAAHLGHQPGVPHAHRAAVPEVLRVVLLRVQGQVTSSLNQGKGLKIYLNAVKVKLTNYRPNASQL